MSQPEKDFSTIKNGGLKNLQEALDFIAPEKNVNPEEIMERNKKESKEVVNEFLKNLKSISLEEIERCIQGAEEEDLSS